MSSDFTLPEHVIYLDGNSLGAMPSTVPGAMTDALERQWAADLITSWNSNDWWTLPGRLGDRIGALVGAAPGQTMCGDSTSVQLFQALTAAARMRPERTRLLVDGTGFPTDTYIADSVGRMCGLEVVRVHPSEIASHLDDSTAVVCLSLVDYRTGELFDLAGISAQVHEAGAVMIWDLCHAAGALPVALDEAEVDLAVGCTYKYLNGGPGSPAFLYVARRHLAGVDLPLTGWHGHADPFGLSNEFSPAPSIERARIGTPPMLSMLALSAALDAFDEVDLSDVRARSLELTDAIIAVADSDLTGFGVEVVTPREHERRGSHVSLRMPEAYRVCQALIERGVIGDFRAPDMLRLGCTPLYLEVSDVLAGMRILAEVLADGSYRDERFAVRETVT